MKVIWKKEIKKKTFNIIFIFFLQVCRDLDLEFFLEHTHINKDFKGEKIK